MTLLAGCSCSDLEFNDVSAAAVVDTREDRVTFGSHTSNVSVADVTTEKVIFTASGIARQICIIIITLRAALTTLTSGVH